MVNRYGSDQPVQPAGCCSLSPDMVPAAREIAKREVAPTLTAAPPSML